MLHCWWLNLFLIKKIFKKENQWLTHHISCIREDTVPLCCGPYQMSGNLAACYQRWWKTESVYHLSEVKRESETSTWFFVQSQQPWAKCTWILGGTGGHVCVMVFILSLVSKNNLLYRLLKFKLKKNARRLYLVLFSCSKYSLSHLNCQVMLNVK